MDSSTLSTDTNHPPARRLSINMDSVRAIKEKSQRRISLIAQELKDNKRRSEISMNHSP